MTPVLRPYLLSAGGLALAAMGALLYAVAIQTDGLVSDAQAQASPERRPVDTSATYLEQMKLTQETLRNFGYAPGAMDGVMRFETASALRAFQPDQAPPEVMPAAHVPARLGCGLSPRSPRHRRAG